MSDANNLSDEERRARVKRFLLSVAGVAVVFGLVIGGVLYLVLAVVGVQSSTSTSSDQATAPFTPLPSTALPVTASPKPLGTSQPTRSTPSPSASPSASPSPSQKTPGGSGAITLVSNEDHVSPMQQIDFSGSWPNHDGVELKVQHRDGGRWTDFADVRATVNSGTFTTYVMTGTTGRNVFRVVQVGGKAVSNPVVVRVG